MQHMAHRLAIAGAQRLEKCFRDIFVCLAHVSVPPSGSLMISPFWYW
jgi:hypothetical protein